MKLELRVGVALSTLIVVLGTTVAPSVAAAPKPGTSCKTLGQKIVAGKLTYTCTKSGSKLMWSKGTKLPLRVTTQVLPAAISGKAYRAAIAVIGGTGYHFCKLQKGSVLPPGYSLNSKTCIITGIGEILPAGTTQRVSPPFVILVSDSAVPKAATIRLTTSIVTYPPAPEISVLKGSCQVGVSCASMVATASGGTSPYTFTNGSGFPPIGLFVMSESDGAYLTGTAMTPETGHALEVCVVDFAGRKACKKTTVDVLPAPTFTVTVSKGGDGQGTVLADYGPINCGEVCQANYSVGLSVRLDARSNPGSVFSGWSGECTGSGSCALKTDANKSVTATFTLNASGTYSGTAIWPNMNLPGRTGCEGSTRNSSLTIEEGADGKITGKAVINFSGSRNGGKITVTVDTIYGARGPYTWGWDGTNLAGILPAFCFNTSTGALLNESVYTFNYKKG